MALIICVEDEAELREDLAEELGEAGHDIIHAGDGEEGLSRIIETAPDLIISDITMPRMGGYELFQIVRERHPHLSTVPFIFLTALADRKNVIEGTRLGVDHYLTKPVDYEMLLATVESSLVHASQIKARHDAEFVKLYNVLRKQSNAGDAKPAFMSIALIVKHPDKMAFMADAFEDLGYRTMYYPTAEAFSRSSARREVDLVFVSYEVADLRSFEALLGSQKPSLTDAPVLLLAPSGNHGARHAFDGEVPYPYKPTEIFKALIKWGAVQAAAAR